MRFTDRATEVVLFRYALIREPADPALSKAEWGRLVRALAAQAHTGPGSEEVREDLAGNPSLSFRAS
jgi:hypothetical protein